MALQDRKDTFFDETEGYNDYAKSQTPDEFGERITYSDPTDSTAGQTGTGSDAAQPSGMDLTEDDDDDKKDEEVYLTDSEGRRLCKVRDCDQVANVDEYCRFHYLLLWKISPQHL